MPALAVASPAVLLAATPILLQASGVELPAAPLNLLIILATAALSVLAFRRAALQEKLIFCPEEILAGKEWYRLLSSAFIHADWLHLLFNLYSLYIFGSYVEQALGPLPFAAIYFISILGGSLLSLLLHRRDSRYRALGASGGVCGVIFASIFLLPGIGIYIFPLPVAVPSWLYALLFVLGSFYGIKTNRYNIGHDAHLGGAIVGLLVTTALYPNIVKLNPVLYPAVLLLALAMFLYLAWTSLRPDSPTPLLRPTAPRPVRPPARKKPPALDLDTILDKVSKSGINSLTREEHEFLRNASKGQDPE